MGSLNNNCPFTDAVERLVREASSVKITRVIDRNDSAVLYEERGLEVARFAPLFAPDKYSDGMKRCLFHPDVAFTFQSRYEVRIEVCFSCNLVKVSIEGADVPVLPVLADCDDARSMFIATLRRYTNDPFFASLKE